MGRTFGSIHIKNADMNDVASLAAGHVVCEVMPGWVSVLDEVFGWGTTHAAARKLSLALPGSTMLSVEYFDDDFVEFALYRAGKKRARHIPASYEEFDRHVGRMAEFRELLGLSGKEEKFLRLIFRETDPGTSVNLFESLLGCPICMAPDDLTPSESARSREYLEAYAARKRQKVKNHTGLTLSDEGEAYFPSYHLTYPIQRRLPDGSIELRGVDGAGRLCAFETDGKERSYAVSCRKGFLDGFSENGGGRWRPPGLCDENLGLRYEIGGWHTLRVYEETAEEYCAELQMPENELPELLCILPGSGLVVLQGESTLEVYDGNLKLLSRHKTRGWVYGTLPRDDGGISVLTYHQGETAGLIGRDWHIVSPDWVRVYCLK